MKKILKHLIWIIPCLSVTLIWITMPLAPSYYTLKTIPWRIFYIFSIYGMAIWIVIPIGIIASLIAFITYKETKYKTRLIKLTKRFFLVVSIIILLMNGALAFSKFIFKKDPFPIQKYSDIVSTTQDVSSIKNGVFKSIYGSIIRQGENHRVEYENGEIDNYKVNWLKNGEHHLVYFDIHNSINDTLWVKVTAIEETYYECYYKYGELAEYDKIEIVK